MKQYAEEPVRGSGFGPIKMLVLVAKIPCLEGAPRFHLLASTDEAMEWQKIRGMAT
jgi:hypothetical protein